MKKIIAMLVMLCIFLPVLFAQESNQDNLNIKLHESILTGNIGLIKELLDSGADPNFADDVLGSPLKMAAERMANHKNPMPEIYEMLIAYGADPKLNNSDSLAFLVRSGNLSFQKLAIQKGANPLVIDDHNRTLLHHCVLGRFNQEIWDYLIELGVDPDVKDKWGGMAMGYFGK